VEETGVPGENHPPVAIHRQTLPYNVVHLTIMATTAQTTIGPSILDLVSKDEIPYFILSLKIIGFDGINNLFNMTDFIISGLNCFISLTKLSPNYVTLRQT
jgi:hypothetical protein